MLSQLLGKERLVRTKKTAQLSMIDTLDNKTKKYANDGRSWSTDFLDSISIAIIDDHWPVCLNCGPHFQGLKADSIAGHIAKHHTSVLKLVSTSKEKVVTKLRELQLADSVPKYDKSQELPPLPLLPIFEGKYCSTPGCSTIFKEGSKVQHAHKTIEACLYQSYQHNGPFRRVSKPASMPTTDGSMFERLKHDTLDAVSDSPTPAYQYRSTVRNTLPHVAHFGCERFLGENASEAGRAKVIEMCRQPGEKDPRWGWITEMATRFLWEVEDRARAKTFWALAIFDGFPRFVYLKRGGVNIQLTRLYRMPNQSWRLLNSDEAVRKYAGIFAGLIKLGLISAEMGVYTEMPTLTSLAGDDYRMLLNEKQVELGRKVIERQQA